MVFVPRVGDLVRHTIYEPFTEIPKSKIYRPARIMLVRGVIENYEGRGVTRYHMADPERPNDESRFSYTESDWCDVESIAEEMGRLF